MENGDNNAVKDGKNSSSIVCQRCQTVILKPQTAAYTKKQMFLPHMKKKSANQAPDDGETLSEVWLVNDMFTFENVGFSNTVGTTKFLICAECEVGPIGWHDTSDAKAFYVALDRVKNEG